VPIQPTDTRRGQLDVIGYPTREDQLKKVVAQSETAARQRHGEIAGNWNETTRFVAGVCPHDDYYYAARLYNLVLKRLIARRIILFGVSHKARLFKVKNRMVFDSFSEWFTPGGPVQVSDIRDEIIHGLDPESYLQNNDMHTLEHSLEGIVHYLRALNPDVEIIPILIPAMHWDRIKQLSDELAEALLTLMRKNKWIPGEDIAILCSNDGVHYGDSQWGGSGYAPFGMDLEGYRKAVDQDLDICNRNLSGEITDEKLKSFLHRCVDPEEITRYRITWCGRFSVTFGLRVVSELTRRLGLQPLKGFLLDYGTSISEASLDTSELGDLGPTAPANFHHFVGYPALGYI